MALLVDELKERLVNERDLTKLWNSFMDMTMLKEFQDSQRPLEDHVLQGRLADASKAILSHLPIKGAVTMALFELPLHGLIHGPLTLPKGVGNIFYFRDIDAGLLVVPNVTTRLPHQFTLARFAIGRPLEKAPAPSVH